MVWLQGVLLAYGALNIVLGIIGYQAGSVVSLYAGGGAGILLIGSAALARSHPKVGYAIAALVCLALLGRFLPTLFREFKVIPGFVLVLGGAIVLICLVFGHFLARKA